MSEREEIRESADGGEQTADELGGIAGSRISRRSLLKRAAAGGALLSTPALLAACGGDDDEEAEEGAEAAGGETAAKSDLTFYSVTHGESGNVFWAIYRNGIRDA